MAAELCSAIEADDLTKVRQLILEDTDVNVKDEEGVTPLHISAIKGNIIITKGIDF